MPNHVQLILIFLRSQTFFHISLIACHKRSFSLIWTDLIIIRDSETHLPKLTFTTRLLSEKTGNDLICG